MVVAPATLLKKVGDLQIVLVIDGCSTSPSPIVRNRGVILDSTLTFRSHQICLLPPKCLAQGHIDTQLGGAGDRTSNLSVTRQLLYLLSQFRVDYKPINIGARLHNTTPR